MIVAGSMIGSAIFIVTSEMSRQLGSAGWLMISWLIAGLLTITGALSYGELASMMPKAGGQYVYLREAFSPISHYSRTLTQSLSVALDYNFIEKSLT